MSQSQLKPSLLLRYADDTFILWPHDNEALEGFLHHLNSLRPTIKFTLEVKYGTLPFLDVKVIMDFTTFMAWMVVNRKPTHTDHYLKY